MQDDLTDAVKWAISEGVADPDHVCIYGASYGGYATMAGITLTPELYSLCGELMLGYGILPCSIDRMEDGTQDWVDGLGIT